MALISIGSLSSLELSNNCLEAGDNIGNGGKNLVVFYWP